MVGIVDFIQIWWNVKIRNEGLVFIFVLGFGYNVDMVFFEVLVYENGGFVWRIYEEFDVSDQLEIFYVEIFILLLVDVNVEYIFIVIVFDQVIWIVFL